VNRENLPVSSTDRSSYHTFQTTPSQPAEGGLTNGILLSDIRSNDTLTKHDSGFLSALWNFIKSFIGLGVITIANVMQDAGIVLGSSCMLFSGFLSLYGTNIMVRSRRQFLKDRYQEIMKQDYISQGANNPRMSYERPLEELNAIEIDQNTNPRTMNLASESEKTTISLLYKNTFIKQYADLGKAAYGENGFRFTIVTLVIQQLMVVIAYLYFLDEYFQAYACVPVLIPV